MATTRGNVRDCRRVMQRMCVHACVSSGLWARQEKKKLNLQTGAKILFLHRGTPVSHRVQSPVRQPSASRERAREITPPPQPQNITPCAPFVYTRLHRVSPVPHAEPGSHAEPAKTHLALACASTLNRSLCVQLSGRTCMLCVLVVCVLRVFHESTCETH